MLFKDIKNATQFVKKIGIILMSGVVKKLLFKKKIVKGI